jgi:hypothetical protein
LRPASAASNEEIGAWMSGKWPGADNAPGVADAA